MKLANVSVQLIALSMTIALMSAAPVPKDREVDRGSLKVRWPAEEHVAVVAEQLVIRGRFVRGTDLAVLDALLKTPAAAPDQHKPDGIYLLVRVDMPNPLPVVVLELEAEVVGVEQAGKISLRFGSFSGPGSVYALAYALDSNVLLPDGVRDRILQTPVELKVTRVVVK